MDDQGEERRTVDVEVQDQVVEQRLIPSRRHGQAAKRETTLRAPPAPRAKPEGWFDRLGEALLQHARQPFAWGRSDCLTLVADAVRAQTGEDIWPDTDRDKVATKKGAERELARRGFGDIAEAFASRFAEIELANAHIGDIAIVVNDDETLTCGVVVGSDIVVKSESGSGRVGRDRATRAFRVEAK